MIENWLYFEHRDGSAILECAHCGATGEYSSLVLAVANTPDEPCCQPPKVDKLAGFTLSPEGASLAAADLQATQAKMDFNTGSFESALKPEKANTKRGWQI